MTTATASLQWVKTSEYGIPHVNPAIFATEDNHVFIWTSSVNHFLRHVEVSTETENKPMQVPFSRYELGVTIDIRMPKRIMPNAVFLHDKKSGSYFVYSFGDSKYPFLIRYNLAKRKEENLNLKDILEIGSKNAISSAARTCVFGKDNEYILVTSKCNELLIYSVLDNKFVLKEERLEKFLSDKDRKDLSTRVKIYISKTRDSNYLCKVKEENNVAEFFMINDSYVTLLTIGYKDKKFTIKPMYAKNNFTNVVESNKIQHFGCCYFSDYSTIMICGGIDAEYKTKKFVCFYNVISKKFYFSKIELPVRMAHHGIAYLKDQNWLFLIPGARYINEEREYITDTSYYISLDAYKPLLIKSKKEMIAKLSNEKLKSTKE